MTPTIAYQRGLRVHEPAAARATPRRIGRRAATHRLTALLVADVLAIGLSLAIATLLPHGDELTRAPVAGLLVAAWFVAARASGLNAVRAAHRESTGEEIRLVLACSAIAILATVTVGLEASTAIGGWVVVLSVAVLLSRALARAVCARLPAARVRTLVLGSGAAGGLVSRRVAHGATHGITIVGVVGSHGPGPGLPFLGAVEEAAAIADEHDVQHVIVAPGGEDGDALWRAVDELVCAGVRVDVVASAGARLDGVVAVAGVPCAHVASHTFGLLGRTLKRALDVVGSLALLVVLSPLLALVALAIRLDSPGPVLFRQRRIGACDRGFTVLKFRSMRDEAHAARAALLGENGHISGDDRMFKMTDDPRVTRVGRVIRRTSIDELPQLVNVLRGEMSLVGPRPLIPEEDRFVEGRGRRRMALKPGLTGPWQVLGRSQIPFGEMVELDCDYVAGWTPLRDIQLLLRTAPALARRSGAY